jgi:hypothetical protein
MPHSSRNEAVLRYIRGCEALNSLSLSLEKELIMPNFWIELGEDQNGTWQPPGGYIHNADCTVYRHTKKTRFRAICNDESGSNQGSLEVHNGGEREYRADSLDDLMRIAVSGEREALDEDWYPRMAAAIRNAVAKAEDAVDEEAVEVAA